MNAHLHRLRDLAAQLEGDGAEPGTDFFIHHVTTAGASSEFYGLKAVGDDLELYYYDLGHSQTVLLSNDVEAVCARFRELVLETSAAHDGPPYPGGAGGTA